jgi:hypothetical protein
MLIGPCCSRRRLFFELLGDGPSFTLPTSAKGAADVYAHCGMLREKGKKQDFTEDAERGAQFFNPSPGS